MSDPKRPRGRPSTMNAADVADVAMTAYRRADPADVSINAICQMAGVSKPSLYREFGNEDGLMCAVLERYAEQVLSKVFVILGAGQDLATTLDALIDFAADDTEMETGCLFYKMRAGRHRLGPKTLEAVAGIEAAGIAAYQDFLNARRAAGDWPGEMTATAGARYLTEQIGLAVTQRTSGEDKGWIRDMLTSALSIFTRH